MDLTAGDFRERVNREAGEGVPIRFRVKASDQVLRWLRGRGSNPTDRDVGSAVDLARTLAVAPLPQGQTTPLPDTPYSRAIADDWLKILDPFVTTWREASFDDPQPPFALNGWSAAAAWIEDRLERVERKGALTGPLRARVGELAMEVLEETDWHITASPNECDLLYYDRDGSRVMRVPVPDPPLGPGWQIFKPPVVNLAYRSGELSLLCGCSQPDLVRYLLCGVIPEFPRAVVRGHTKFDQLPDGTEVTGARVVVEFYTPDVTWHELQGLLTKLRRTWSLMEVSVPAQGTRQYPRLTELDRKLQGVVQELGGPPERPDKAWWQKVELEWERQGYKARSIDALRKHWSRLQAKEQIPGVRPGGNLQRTNLP